MSIISRIFGANAKTSLTYALRSNRTTLSIKRDCPLMNIHRDITAPEESESCIIYKKSKVVPDVVSIAPKLPALVRYNGAVVSIGNELTPTMVKDPPTYIHWPVQDQHLYTVCLTDPDAPSRDDPKFREWLHWLVVNVPEGRRMHQKGTVLAEYIGAAPPQGTGLHRYVFLVYQQPKKLDCDEKKLTSDSAEGRGNFKIEDFAKKYELGNPLAGNFFYARWDACVEIIQKQLSGD